MDESDDQRRTVPRDQEIHELARTLTDQVEGSLFLMGSSGDRIPALPPNGSSKSSKGDAIAECNPSLKGIEKP
jgi:hypothetical protein